MEGVALIRQTAPETLAPFLAKFLPADELPGVLANSSHGFTLDIDGRTVFAWSWHVGKNGLWVDAAGGHAPGVDLTGACAAFLEAQAQGLPAVGFQTNRPGLVRRAQRLGYEMTGRYGSTCTMRKALK